MTISKFDHKNAKSLTVDQRINFLFAIQIKKECLTKYTV